MNAEPGICEAHWERLGERVPAIRLGLCEACFGGAPLVGAAQRADKAVALETRACHAGGDAGGVGSPWRARALAGGAEPLRSPRTQARGAESGVGKAGRARALAGGAESGVGQTGCAQTPAGGAESGVGKAGRARASAGGDAGGVGEKKKF